MPEKIKRGRGHPRIYAEPLENVMFRLPVDMIAELRAMGREKQNFVRAAIREKLIVKNNRKNLQEILDAIPEGKENL